MEFRLVTSRPGVHTPYIPIQKAALRPPFDSIFSCEKWLQRFYVLGLPALRAFDHVELNLLTLLQAAESRRLDGGEVHEHILTILAADETITLGVVEPDRKS